MDKKLLFFTIALFAGGAGGVLALLLVVKTPFLASRLGISKDQTVIVSKTEKITVEQSAVIKKAIAKNLPALVKIRAFHRDTLLSDGLGFIIGADGLVLTRMEWVTPAADKVIVERNGEILIAEIVKKSDSGLVLLKIDASNLPVVSFAEPESLEMGDFVFIIGLEHRGPQAEQFVNVGILKAVKEGILETNIQEDVGSATGSPLLNAAGDVVGISAVDSSGYVFAVPSEVIKQFAF